MIPPHKLRTTLARHPAGNCSGTGVSSLPIVHNGQDPRTSSEALTLSPVKPQDNSEELLEMEDSKSGTSLGLRVVPGPEDDGGMMELAG